MYSRLKFDKTFRDKREQLLNSGKWKLTKAGRLQKMLVGGSWKTPWIFISQPRKKFCWLWNEIYCQHFGLIPTPCRFNCWKTVIKPPNVKGLFHLYDVLKMVELPSKCGIDVRPYTFGSWAGFIYGDTLAQGKRYYKTVREHLPDDFSVILKRGCTEMEQVKPSDEWDDIEQWELWRENELNDFFEFEEMEFRQPDWLRRDIQEKWIERAIEIGDETAREMAEAKSGNPDIWPKMVLQSVTYHDRE